MKISAATFKRFEKELVAYYRASRRSLPWRDRMTKHKRSLSTNDWTYRVVVSELMLQQTQVARVIHKYESWLKIFPDWQSLAHASTASVLREWSGLGYNRRALFLKRIAETIGPGSLPQTYDGLRALPGIGPNTAGSILAFAFDIPRVFIETNIRSVFIHFFFPEIEKREGKKACKKIHDDEIVPIIETALDRTMKGGTSDTQIFKNNPREWYYALMDYGSDLKRRLPNPSRRSAHHVRQSPFKGSNRELRSGILRFILKAKATGQLVSEIELKRAFQKDPSAQVLKNLNDLTREGFIVKIGKQYRIAS